jgi:hypothetical protein
VSREGCRDYDRLVLIERFCTGCRGASKPREPTPGSALCTLEADDVHGGAPRTPWTSLAASRALPGCRPPPRPALRVPTQGAAVPARAAASGSPSQHRKPWPWALGGAPPGGPVPPPEPVNAQRNPVVAGQHWTGGEGVGLDYRTTLPVPTVSARPQLCQIQGQLGEPATATGLTRGGRFPPLSGAGHLHEGVSGELLTIGPAVRPDGQVRDGAAAGDGRGRAGASPLHAGRTLAPDLPGPGGARACRADHLRLPVPRLAPGYKCHPWR